MRRRPRATASWLVALVTAVSVLSACGTSSSPSQDRDGAVCNTADKAVVRDIMSTAQTNFKDGESITKDFTFVKAATAPIPEDERRYGAATLMVLLVAINIESEAVPGGLQGAQGPVYVVLDADGEPLGPLGQEYQPFFDITPPADPGWDAWANGIDRSDFAADLFGCVNPN